MIWSWVHEVQINEQPTVVHRNWIVHAIFYFFYPLNQLWWDGLFQGLHNLMKVRSINLMQPWDYGNYVVKIHCYSTVRQQISWIMAKLMQDAINMPLSFIVFMLQFHMKASYLVTLSCLMNKMKLSKCCSRPTWMVAQKCDVAPLWSLHD
jgi:hypothetical protein